MDIGAHASDMILSTNGRKLYLAKHTGTVNIPDDDCSVIIVSAVQASVEVIDTQTFFSQSIPLGSDLIYRLILSPDGSTLAVLTQEATHLLDSTSLSTFATIPLGGYFGSYCQNGEVLFVSSPEEDSLIAINRDTGEYHSGYVPLKG